MEYKTTIEIVTQADDQYDAAEIAGEYLRGSFEPSVKMRCKTKPIVKCSAFKFFVAVLVSATLFSFGMRHREKVNAGFLNNISDQGNISAVQPPLRTSMRDHEFADDWLNKSVN